MGMYTQVRGWLNIDSIGYQREKLLEGVLTSACDDYEKLGTGRWWVCQDTVLHTGLNGCAYLFFGTEFKNYDEDAEKWIRFLLGYFPNAEGRIDFQYEEEYIEEDNCKYWLICGGDVIREGWNKVWCQGYGNMSGVSK